MNKEKQIEEMSAIIKADYKEWLDITGCLPKGTSYYYECLGGGDDCAKKLYDAGFRKMDEVTLKLDLGDITLEEIKQIAEKFKDVATGVVPVPNNEEQIRKETAMDILEAIYFNPQIKLSAELTATVDKLADKYIRDNSQCKVSAEHGSFIEQIRNHVAKDILGIVADKTSCDHIAMKQYDWFKTLAKKYGVEVEE